MRYHTTVFHELIKLIPLMKQMLRIRHCIGRSDNAVRIQIAVALIADLLLHLLQQITRGNMPCWS